MARAAAAEQPGDDDPGTAPPAGLERAAPWAEGDGRPEYRDQLAAIDAALLRLAEEVVDRLARVSTALVEGGRGVVGETAAWHGTIEGRCRRLEDDCFVLVARQAPVAADLREVFAVIRSINDVERSAKLLRHLAESLRHTEPPVLSASLRAAVEVLAGASRSIFGGGVRAWRDRDGLAINELEELDDEVDRLQERLLAELYRGGHRTEDVAALVLLARWYERLADHGVELARHVSWAVTGDRVEGGDGVPPTADGGA